MNSKIFLRLYFEKQVSATFFYKKIKEQHNSIFSGIEVSPPAVKITFPIQEVLLLAPSV